MPLTLTLSIPKFAIDGALEALTAVNAIIMRALHDAGLDVPDVYSSGVVYRREPAGREQWQNAAELLDAGHGDCEDLAAYQAAWLRVFEGEPARAIAYQTRRRRLLHAVVLRGDGETIEDPSRALLPRRNRR